MAQGREVFARFVQDLRAAWGAVQDVESRMKQFAKLLEGLVSNPALRESSKTWRRWAKRGANGGDLSRPATGRAQARGDWKNSGTGKPSSVSSAYVLMKERVSKEKRLYRRVRRIEKSLVNTKKRI